MAMRRCPECEVPVKLENLERHVSSVHPGRTVELTRDEQRALRTRRTESGGPNVSRRGIALVGATVLAIVLVGAAIAYLPRAGPTEMHIHSTLRVTIDGASRTVPVNIGVDEALWRDHSLDPYGMGGMSPLHTHDATGLIHIESHGVREYTLGEFFSVWGQSFDSTQVLGHPAPPGHRVRMVIDGVEMGPNPALVLRDGMQVQLICDVG